MSKIRNIPPITGSVIWAKQIERQLNMFMGRVEDVLGKDWETHVDRQKLKAKCESFRIELGNQNFFKDWEAKNKKINLKNLGQVFCIQMKDNNLILNAEIDFNFFKEINLVDNLPPNIFKDFQLLNISLQCDKLKFFRLYAFFLRECVNLYNHATKLIVVTGKHQLHVNQMKKKIQTFFLENSDLEWKFENSKIIISKIEQFLNLICNFQVLVEELVTIEQQLKQLSSCSYKKSNFSKILTDIKKSIDYLNLKGFSDLPQLIVEINEKVEAKFAQRLINAMKVSHFCIMDIYYICICIFCMPFY